VSSKLKQFHVTVEAAVSSHEHPSASLLKNRLIFVNVLAKYRGVEHDEILALASGSEQV